MDRQPSEPRILTEAETAALLEQAKRDDALGLNECPRCGGRNIYPEPLYGPNVLACMSCGCRWDGKMRRAEAMGE